MNSREAEVFEEDQKRRSTPLCTGWAAVLAEIQCGRREIPADHPDAIRYGKRLESVEEFATRIAHLAASTQSETAYPTLTKGEIESLIDYHDFSESSADAMDMPESAEYHRKRREAFKAMLPKEPAND